MNNNAFWYDLTIICGVAFLVGCLSMVIMNRLKPTDYSWKSRILIVAQGGHGGYTLREKLRKLMPNAKIQVCSRYELKNVNDHDIYIVAGYNDVLGHDLTSGSFLIYGASKKFLSAVKDTGNYISCQRASILKLITCLGEYLSQEK